MAGTTCGIEFCGVASTFSFPTPWCTPASVPRPCAVQLPRSHRSSHPAGDYNAAAADTNHRSPGDHIAASAP